MELKARRMFYSFVIIFFSLLIGSSQSQEQYRVTNQVYFDIAIDNVASGRIVFGLFGDIAPKTAKNFAQLAARGVKGRSYAGTRIFRAIKRFMIQGGDVLHNNGTGSISIYGRYFKDEEFAIPHISAGLLSAVNNGSNTNGCQYLITTMPAPILDGKQVVFGKVLEGQDIVHRIEYLKTDVKDRILANVTVYRSGIIKTVPFYESPKNYELSLFEWLKAGWFPLSFSFLILGVFHYIMSQLNKYENESQK